MAFMKALLTLCFLLITTIVFSGCYTILLVEDAPESTFVEPAATVVEYIPVYVSVPNPEPVFGQPPPAYIPPAVHVSDNPPSTPPNSDDRRLIQTGRYSVDSNPAPARNDENNTGTRDSGARRNGR